MQPGSTQQSNEKPKTVPLVLRLTTPQQLRRSQLLRRPTNVARPILGRTINEIVDNYDPLNSVQNHINRESVTRKPKVVVRFVDESGKQQEAYTKLPEKLNEKVVEDTRKSLENVIIKEKTTSRQRFRAKLRDLKMRSREIQCQSGDAVDVWSEWSEWIASVDCIVENDPFKSFRQKSIARTYYYAEYHVYPFWDMKTVFRSLPYQYMRKIDTLGFNYLLRSKGDELDEHILSNIRDCLNVDFPMECTSLVRHHMRRYLHVVSEMHGYAYNEEPPPEYRYRAERVLAGVPFHMGEVMLHFYAPLERPRTLRFDHMQSFAEPDMHIQSGLDFDLRKFFSLYRNLPADKIMGKIELLVDCCILMYHSKNWALAMLQMKTYVCHLCDTSISEQVWNHVENIWSHSDIVDVQSADDYMDQFKNCFKNWQSVANSDFVKRLRKMLAMLISLGVFSSTKVAFPFLQFDKFYVASGIADMHWADLWTGVIDTVIYMYERGMTWLNGGCSFMEIIGTPESVTMFEAKYTRVVANIYLYETSQLDRVNMDNYVYERYLTELEEEVQMLHRRLSGPEKRVMASKMLELARVRARVATAMMSMPMREAPYSFYLYGTPGTGKTTAMGIFIHYLLSVNGFDTDPRNIANVRLDDAYQSEIQPYHTVVIVDDMANTKAQWEKNPTVQSVIDYVNNNPKFALKADVESKGRTLLKPKIFAGTGNTPEIEAHVKSNEPLAILRRLGTRITVKVKPEFCKPGSDMIDPNCMVGIVNDAWLFTVEEPVPTGQSTVAGGASQYFWRIVKHNEVELKSVTIVKILEFMKDTSRLHFEQQGKLLRDISELHQLELCEHDMFSSLCAVCGDVGVQASSLSDVLFDLREWSYRVADKVPISLTDHWLVRKPYGLLKALGSLENGVNGMRFFSFLGASMIAAVAPLFAATTPVVICTAAFTYCIIYCYLLVCKIHSFYKTVNQYTLMSFRTRLQKKYCGVRCDHLVMGAVTVSAVLLILKRVRPYVSVFGHKVVEKCDSTDTRKTHIGVQGSAYGHIMKPDEVQRENVYAVPYVEPIKHRHELATSTLDHVENIVKHVLLHARFENCDGLATNCNLFPFRGNVYIAPYHVLRRGWKQVKITRCVGNINGNRVCKFMASSWLRIGDTDLALISLPTLGECMDTSTYFMQQQPPRSHYAATWIHKDADANITMDEFNVVSSMLKVADGHAACDYTYMGWHYKMSFNTQRGFCMAPLISHGKQPYILGFHSAGNCSTNDGRGHFIQLQDLNSTYELLFDRKIGDTHNINVGICSQGNMTLDYPEFDIKHTPRIHEKSPFMFQPVGGHIELFGLHSGRRRRFKSKVCPTYISESVEKFFGKPSQYGPPRDMNTWKPWYADVLSTINVSQLDQKYLGYAYGDLEKRFCAFMEGMSPSQKSEIRPLGDVATLSGIDGVFGIDAMNLQTSMGFPWCKPKNLYMWEMTEKVPGVTRPLELDAAIMEHIREAEDELRRGYRVYLPFRMNLKDEPTKITKDKVRTFAGGNVELLFLLRKYFLPITKTFMDNPEYFECAVGINAHSTQWTRMAEFLSTHGKDRNVAGDYSKYDSRVINQMVLLAFMLMINMAKIAGYDEDDLVIMRGLSAEVAHGLIEYNGEYCMYHSQNLSGHALTVFINNLVNSMYVRYGYYMLFYMLDTCDPEFLHGLEKFVVLEVGDTFTKWCSRNYYKPAELIVRPPPFHQNVALLCYGDDNNMSISEDCTWLNHTLLAYTLSLSDIEYTMADKSSKSVPFLPLQQTTFLKRSFLWNGFYDQYLAPLEMDSLYKTLHSCVESKFLTSKQQAAEAILSVNREMFFHGREAFDDVHSNLLHVISDTHLSGEFPGGGIPGFEFYEAEYVCKNDIFKGSDLFDSYAKNRRRLLVTHPLSNFNVSDSGKALDDENVTL